MRPGRIAYLVGFLVIVASGAYFFVYLGRWEWNRALVAGLLFVAAEIGLGVALVLERLRRLADRLTSLEQGGSGAIAHRSTEAPAQPGTGRFEWLAPKGKGEPADG